MPIKDKNKQERIKRIKRKLKTQVIQYLKNMPQNQQQHFQKKIF